MEERSSLSRVLGVKDVVALAFGTMIGWGWIMLAGKWVAAAGVMGAILAFGIGAVLCIFVGLTYAELTPALPLAGGELVFAYRGGGYVASWFTGWMITFAYVGVAAWEGPAFVTAIDFLFGFPKVGYLWTVAGFDVYLSWVLVGSAAGLALAILNFVGVKSAAMFQITATVAMALGGVAFFISGVTLGDVANMTPSFSGGAGLITVLLMVPAMFVGFDVIPQAAEEMNIPLQKIAKVLIISIIMAAGWYILMIIGISMAAPEAARAEFATTGIPVADSFAFVTNSPMVGKLMIIAAMCGILTSWNGFIIGGTRVIFAMGRAKMLPPIFGKVHAKYQTPYAAIILVGILTMLSPLLGKQALVWFVDASAFGTVLAYFMVAWSFIQIRKKEPDLARPYFVKGGNLVGIIACVVAAGFILLYFPLMPGMGLVWPYEWFMVVGWAILGLVLAVLNKKAYPNVSKQETEMLMFGEEYARKSIVGK